jgi:hypothetical protein
MKRHASVLVLATCVVGAGLLAAVLPSSPVLSESAPLWARALLAAVAWAMFFVVLAPFWFPLAIPSRFHRTKRVAAVVCGALLVAVAIVLLAAAVFTGSMGFAWSAIAVAAALAGTWHLTSRSSGPPSASAELQR